MNKSVYKLSLLLLIIASFTANAQTVFWTEDFSTSTCNKGCMLPYTGVNGTWTWASTGVNGTKANTWYISYQEKGMGRTQCGSSGSDPSLHVGNVAGSPLAAIFCPAGDCGAAYDAGLGNGKVVANAMAQSPVINCTGENTITLSFNYIMKGQTGKDYASVWYNTGAGWTFLVNLAKTATCISGQGKWTYYSIGMPASANNNASVQIGFNWTNNDDGAGADPSFAVDSIQLSVPTVLPVGLQYFNVHYNSYADMVNLDWATASETNNATFTIEHTIDGDTYTQVAKVNGAGNSSETKYYAATDPSPYEGTSYYRLKQTDYDGHSTYSANVPVYAENTNMIKVYPNPAGGFVNVTWYSATEDSKDVISIYDNTGRMLLTNEVSSLYKGMNTYKLDISKLAGGLYFVKLEASNGQIFFNKFIKK